MLAKKLFRVDVEGKRWRGKPRSLFECKRAIYTIQGVISLSKIGVSGDIDNSELFLSALLSMKSIV